MLMRLFVLMSMLFGIIGSVWAQSPNIPEALKPWQEWVLWQHEAEVYCPVIQGKSDHNCVWPGKLAINVQGKRATFNLQVQVYFDGWVKLPGEGASTPFNVKVNDKIIPVSQINSPAVFLSKGTYEISGQLSWQDSPNFIKIPTEIGLLDINVDGRRLLQVDRDINGKVWLAARQQASQKEQDSLSMQVFRKLKDDNPFYVTTQLLLKVAGQDREIYLDSPLLPNFIPMTLSSPLPARLEPDGRLRVQVRGGVWQILLMSRLDTPFTSLSMLPKSPPWPETEIWSFEPVPELRMVEVSGAQPIDPTQTEMPKNWQSFQSFLMAKDQNLKLVQKRRGQATERADQLQLNRTMWLDFSGERFTFQDTLTGQLDQNWRLEALPALELGRVEVDGTDRLITVGATQQAGVEVRQGQLNVLGIGRMQREAEPFSAVGWDRDVQSLNTTLQLPPGWHLLAATGVDRVNAAWIDKWNLLDLFLVLVIAATVLKLFNIRWGVVALLTLVLIYHERGAPIYTWINLLAGIGLLRVMSPGKMRISVEWYYRGSVLLLVLYALPFAVDQVRLGMYPQLAQPSYVNPQYASPESLSAPMPRQMMRGMAGNADKMMAAKEWSSADSMADASSGKAYLEQKKSLEAYDPNAKIQTGPGVPDWTWQQIELTWNGPVMKDQMMRLWLVSPILSSILNFMRVIMIGLLGWVLLTPWRKEAKVPKVLASLGMWILGGLIAGNMLLYASPSMADELPSPQLLEALQSRLLIPDACMPNHCASIGKMMIQASADQLKIQMDVNVQSAIAIPIPSAEGKWSSQNITVNGQPTTALLTQDRILHIALEPGVQSVELVGQMPSLESFELFVPMLPTMVDTDLSGWKIDGLIDDTLKSNGLYFKRLLATGSTLEKLKPGEMPVFVSLNRRLELGLTWKIVTQIIRMTPQRGNINIQMPLLPGERILDETIKVKEGQALIVFSDLQRVVTFESDLPVVPMLTLRASDNIDYFQTWSLDASGIWHVDFSGIPPIHQRLGDGRWQPTWRPWPNEEIKLNITRPEGMAGETMSIDSSSIVYTPGKRAMDAELNLNIRASQGGTHNLTLPQNVKLKDIYINGKSQSINLQGQQLTIPISPGSQTVQVKWQMPFELKSLFQTPLVNLNAVSSNAKVSIQLSKDRWILALGGPSMGPVVLFWGVLLVIVIVAFILNRLKIAPLNTWQWLLLGMGIAVASPLAALGVLAWFFVMGRCEIWKTYFKSSGYTVMQAGLVLLTVIFIFSILQSISVGLLGTPQMQLAAPNNDLIYNAYFDPNQYVLSWYQDQSLETTPKAWTLTLSIYWYRGVMLLWAMWLAISMMRWFKWGWQSFSRGGLWVQTKL
jgi:hypothetical protein